MEVILLTVSQLNCYTRAVLEQDPCLQNIFVIGEISNFKNHYQSGHLYFSLKDENSVINVVMFKEFASRLRFSPKNGMQMLIRGKVSLYEVSGQYQLYAQDMQPQGLGSLNLAFTQLQEKLKKEGLFDAKHKKAIPVYPSKIGIITSPTGAVLHDILNVLERRYPLAEIVFCPVAVQGEKAVGEIVAAINKLNSLADIDVIILGRGGGSLEDLWSFSEEAVARAVFACRIPIISAIGHETDYSICDFVADLRAPTPSAAAELATPRREDVLFEIESLKTRIYELTQTTIKQNKQDLTRLTECGYMQSLPLRLQQTAISLDLLYENLKHACQKQIEGSKQAFRVLAGNLEALSPLKILSLGYNIAQTKSGIARSTSAIKEGEPTTLRFNDGQVNFIPHQVEIQ